MKGGTSMARKKLFVVTDVHGHYTLLMQKLKLELLKLLNN